MKSRRLSKTIPRKSNTLTGNEIKENLGASRLLLARIACIFYLKAVLILLTFLLCLYPFQWVTEAFMSKYWLFHNHTIPQNARHKFNVTAVRCCADGKRVESFLLNQMGFVVCFTGIRHDVLCLVFEWFQSSKEVRGTGRERERE